MKHVEIYTDGCALGNPGQSGGGAVLCYGEHQKEFMFPLGEGTNNTAELLAVICSLEVLKYACHVVVYSDSQITVNCGNGKYKRHKNKDLWRKFDRLVSEHESVTLHWIRKDSHDLNKRAHALANEAANQSAMGVAHDHTG